MSMSQWRNVTCELTAGTVARLMASDALLNITAVPCITGNAAPEATDHSRSRHLSLLLDSVLFWGLGLWNDVAFFFHDCFIRSVIYVYVLQMSNGYT